MPVKLHKATYRGTIVADLAYMVLSSLAPSFLSSSLSSLILSALSLTRTPMKPDIKLKDKLPPSTANIIILGSMPGWYAPTLTPRDEIIESIEFVTNILLAINLASGLAVRASLNLPTIDVKNLDKLNLNHLQTKDATQGTLTAINFLLVGMLTSSTKPSSDLLIVTLSSRILKPQRGHL